jgi:hypothetical protein
MTIEESLVDKCLGTVGIAIGLVACVGASSALNMLVGGPSVIRRLVGLGGIAVACPVAAVSLYLGYLLLRFPEIRRSTAAEIARYAAHQKTPLTPLWLDE